MIGSDQKKSEIRSLRALRGPERIPDAIQWHEGLLLTPQHFQQQQLRAEALLAYQLMNVHPYHWGVRELEIEPAALAEGVIRIERLEAVMPDGLSVFHGGNPPLELELDDWKDDIQSRVERKMPPLMAWLAVSARESHGWMSSHSNRYYSEEGEEIADENTGEGSISIPRLKPRLRIFLSDEPPEKKYVSFPLCEITIRGGGFSLTDFVPPLLEIATSGRQAQSPSDAIAEICRELAVVLRDKARFLSDRLKNQSWAGNRYRLLETRAMIHSMVAGLPRLEAILDSRGVSPYMLWLALCDVAGHLAALGDDPVPSRLPVYNHDDLRATFERIRVHLGRMMNEGVHEEYAVFHFEQEEETGRSRIMLRSEWWDANDRFLIVARAAPGHDAASLSAFLDNCYIGSESVLERIEGARIRGAARAVHRGDEGLGAGRDELVYVVEKDEFVLPGEDLYIYSRAERDRVPAADSIALCVQFVPRDAYHLDDQSIQTLEGEVEDEEVIMLLRGLVGRQFATRTQFFEALEEHLGPERAREYRHAIAAVSYREDEEGTP